MRFLAHLGKTLALAPLLAWACSGGDTTPNEPLGKSESALAWGATSNTMTSLRADHAAASLADANGRVILCGGRSASSTYLATCDLYDPTTNTFTAGPTMAAQRAYPTLSTLGANAVLVAGGVNGGGLVASAVAGTASAWGSAETITGRFQASASVVSSATVIVVGGVDLAAAAVSGAQRRVGTTWSSAGTQARYQHAAVVLSTGNQVFVSGGYSGSSVLDTAAIYSQTGNSWTATNPMVVSSVSAPRRYHTATLLSDGSVLVVGGDNASGVPQGAAMRFNPTSGVWSNAGTAVARSEHSALAIDGFVIVAGGRGAAGSMITSVQSYNPATNTWTDLESLVTARSRFTLTALPGGKALAAGGVTGNGTTYLSSAEVFAPLLLGGSCSGGTANQCASGTCVDGVCCNDPCTGQCQACNEPSNGGSCISVSGVPRGSRSACSNGYLCASGSCATSCTSNAQCQGTHYCTPTGSPKTCAAKKVAGGSCTATNQCVSGLTCVDGVCCESACAGQCEYCNASGSCIATTGAPVGSRSACGGEGAGTTCGSKCDGVNRTQCTFPDETLGCEAASCASGTATLASGCDGEGHCPHVTQPCGAYVCSGTSCRTTCSLDTHCSAGNYCAAPTCAPLREIGEDCTSDNQCADGSCVDSVCCGSSSCPSGSSCAIAPHRGQCRRNLGIGCSSDGQCGSDHCADGVCCNDACSGQCEHCNASGACIAQVGAPVGPREACGGVGAGTDCGARCDGTDREACTFNGTTSIVCRPASCTDGNSFLAVQCDGAGLCPDSSSQCVGFVCDEAGVACLTSCDGDEDCEDGYFCEGDVCAQIPGLGDECENDSGCETGHCTDGHCCGVAACEDGYSCGLPDFEGLCTKDLGTECEGNAECGSGHCVDGVCCKTSCTGRCEACNNDGQEGTCAPRLGQPASPRAPCGDSDNACDAACDGSNRTACAFPDDGTTCGERSCDDGVEIRRGTCDGEGTCSAPTHACDAYACDSNGTACNTECESADECAEDYFCSDGECIPNLSTGRDCDNDAGCASGHCVDGVCCGAASCPTGSTCAYAGHRGECFMDDGTECSSDDDCGSGHCVDGACCDSLCDGQCEACDVAGRVGNCSPVSGNPHGAREACSAGDGLCGVTTCDGAESTASCVGFANGSATECAPSKCDGVDFTFAATCDGDGACQTAKRSSCVPFRCNDAGCLTTCSTNAQCADGFTCRGGDCVAEGAACSVDRKKSIPLEGPETECAPYLCASDGTCATECQTSSDCGTGNACDTSGSPGVCRPVTAANAGADDGGCGCKVPRRSTGNAGYAWLVAALASAAVLRRRRSLNAASADGSRSRNATGSVRGRAAACSRASTA
jgi:hypothetical protein